MSDRSGRPLAKAGHRLAPTAERGIYISLEAGFWLALTAAAFALRLIRLDAAPLSLTEAANALDIWRVAHASPPAGWIGDVASALTVYLLRLTDGSDSLVRLLPALFGALLVPSLWLLRRPLGSGGGTLMAAAFLTASTLTAFTARSGTGAAAGPLLSVLVVWAAFCYLEEQKPAHLTLLATFVGLAAATDAVAVTTVLALALFLAFQWSWSRDATVSRAVAALAAERSLLLVTLVAGLAAFGLAVTHFGTDVHRLTTPALSQWVALFSTAADGVSRRYYLDVLVGYELPLLLLGVVAYLALLRRWLLAGQDALNLWQRFLLVWTTVAAVTLLVASRRAPEDPPLLLLPLSLTIGVWIADLLRPLSWRALSAGTPFLLPVVPLLALATLRMSAWALRGRWGDGTELTVVLLAAWGALALVTLALIRMQRAARAGGLLLGLVLLAPLQFHSLTALNYHAGTEYAVRGRLTPRAAMLSTVANETASGAIAIDPSLADAIGWYMRSRPGVVVAGSVPPSADVLVRPTAQGTHSGYRPLGGVWRVAEGWYPQSFDLLKAWRWYVYRQPWGPTRPLDASLLIKDEPAR